MPFDKAWMPGAGRDRGGNVPTGGVVVRSNVIIFRVE